MKNTISQRVADFLKNYPPFSFLNLREINTLSEEVSIIYKEKDSIVFKENDVIITTADDYISNQITFISLQKKINIKMFLLI